MGLLDFKQYMLNICTGSAVIQQRWFWGSCANTICGGFFRDPVLLSQWDVRQRLLNTHNTPIFVEIGILITLLKSSQTCPGDQSIVSCALVFLYKFWDVSSWVLSKEWVFRSEKFHSGFHGSKEGYLSSRQQDQIPTLCSFVFLKNGVVFCFAFFNLKARRN